MTNKERLFEDGFNSADVTGKAMNQEAIKKSNREIAEEINDEICSLLDDADDSEQNFTDEIEAILNKYGSITSILNKYAR